MKKSDICHDRIHRISTVPGTVRRTVPPFPVGVRVRRCGGAVQNPTLSDTVTPRPELAA